ncbi:MAG: hypothetical protein R3D01_11600 [Hyphomicrobiales bacterium]
MAEWLIRLLLVRTEPGLRRGIGYDVGVPAVLVKVFWWTYAGGRLSARSSRCFVWIGRIANANSFNG